MKLLLDTHAFLWWIEGTPAVGRRARVAVANPDNEVLFSIASCWELAIKLSLGKLRLAESLDRFIPEQLRVNGFSLLDVDLRHVVRVADLPFRHRDPFDRLLVAQALEDDLTVVSADRVFRKYGVAVLW
ncbi:MAG TPA: type II toxin-antitoxin system VapC family toxin [Vicinamibacterales bacterium]|nr:type II toxin-antitoxin system VapC family toxin [Vicinamibacterales bacterium]